MNPAQEVCQAVDLKNETSGIYTDARATFATTTWIHSKLSQGNSGHYLVHFGIGMRKQWL